MEPSELKDLQLDALREVANIGAGHAATALSQLTNRRIMISVPHVSFASDSGFAEILGDAAERAAVVSMRTLGDLPGATALVIPEDHARLLCDFLLGRVTGSTATFDDIEMSTLAEAGNIIGAAYLNALASFMGMMLVPSVPQVSFGDAEAVARALPTSHKGDVILCAATEFKFAEEEAGHRLHGYLLHLPDSRSLNVIFEAIKMA